MIRFIEIESQSEIYGFVQYMLKVIFSEKDKNRNALLVDAKYYPAKKKVFVSSDYLYFDSDEKEWIPAEEKMNDELKEEIEKYVLNQLENIPRGKTTEEIREVFLEKIWHMIEYWYEQNYSYMPDGKKEPKTEKDKMQGLVFSILAMLDGSNVDIPGFIVAPSPHEEDKDYYIENGENYYPYNDPSIIKGDISGCLHELFYPVGRKLNYVKD